MSNCNHNPGQGIPKYRDYHLNMRDGPYKYSDYTTYS